MLLLHRPLLVPKFEFDYKLVRETCCVTNLVSTVLLRTFLADSSIPRLDLLIDRCDVLIISLIHCERIIWFTIDSVFHLSISPLVLEYFSFYSINDRLVSKSIFITDFANYFLLRFAPE